LSSSLNHQNQNKRWRKFEAIEVAAMLDNDSDWNESDEEAKQAKKVKLVMIMTVVKKNMKV